MCRSKMIERWNESQIQHEKGEKTKEAIFAYEWRILN